MWVNWFINPLFKMKAIVIIVDYIIPVGDRNKPECRNLNHNLQFTKTKQNQKEISSISLEISNVKIATVTIHNYKEITDDSRYFVMSKKIYIKLEYSFPLRTKGLLVFLGIRGSQENFLLELVSSL